MGYKGAVLLFLLVVSHLAHGQMWPAEGAKLNYTQVMFEHPKVPGAEVYLLQVYADNGDEKISKVAESIDSSTATMISGLQFGRKYSWKYTGIKSGRQTGWVGPMSFEILKNKYADTSVYRLRVLNNDVNANETGLLVLDEVRTIADRNGNFVWFLPPDSETGRPEGEINDLQLTRAGTLTFLEGRKAVESDLNGNILWMAPKNTVLPDSVKGLMPNPYSYNHCFKRLADGNYMVQSKINEPVPPSLISTVNPSQTAAPASLSVGELQRQPAGAPMSIPTAPRIIGGATGLQYDIIKEFDKKGRLIWSWNSKNYFTLDEVKNMLQAPPDSGVLAREPGGHLNAFDVDEKNGFVFAGFRNVSRVVKIDLKSGKAIRSWGAAMPLGGADDGDGFFAKQHDVTLLHDGSIAVFSNGNLPSANSGLPVEPSSVVIFSDSAKSRLLWKFDCRFDGIVYHSLRGGSINELKDGNLLVCMGKTNRVFEVTREKKVVWQAEMEKYDLNFSAWQPNSLYQVYYTSSLYPCYFSVTTDSDILCDRAPSCKLRIFNAGTEEDRYKVKISSVKGAYGNELTTQVIRSGKSVNLEISPNKKPAGGDVVKVIISSVTNPDFIRIVSLPLQSGR